MQIGNNPTIKLSTKPKQNFNDTTWMVDHEVNYISTRHSTCVRMAWGTQTKELKGSVVYTKYQNGT